MPSAAAGAFADQQAVQADNALRSIVRCGSCVLAGSRIPVMRIPGPTSLSVMSLPGQGRLSLFRFGELNLVAQGTRDLVTLQEPHLLGRKSSKQPASGVAVMFLAGLLGKRRAAKAPPQPAKRPAWGHGSSSSPCPAPSHASVRMKSSVLPRTAGGAHSRLPASWNHHLRAAAWLISPGFSGPVFRLRASRPALKASCAGAERERSCAVRVGGASGPPGSP